MTYFITEIGIACFEKSEKAYFLGSPILSIVVVMCSDVKEIWR
jgi:hypothetical protein